MQNLKSRFSFFKGRKVDVTENNGVYTLESNDAIMTEIRDIAKDLQIEVRLVWPNTPSTCDFRTDRIQCIITKTGQGFRIKDIEVG